MLNAYSLSGVAQLEHLMKTFEKDKLPCGLWKSDVFVKDKQNVQAALRILQKEVHMCMEAWNAEETVSTRIYLKMGQYMLRAYTERDLSVQERAMFAWTPVAFLRYWKAWLVISCFPIENHFVSLQTYEDFLLSGHSLIMSMKMFALYYPAHPFQPWTFGSNSCEELFSKLCGFTWGKSELCLLDLVDFAGRIQKLEELKMKGKKINDISPPQWPQDIDEHIKKGMQMAEREVLKMLEHLGMLPNLVKGNVVRLDGNDIVGINNPDLETFAMWDNAQDAPDETKVISSEELLELDNGVLMETLDQLTDQHQSALLDLAAAASLNRDVEEGNDEDAEDVEEEESPSRCALYKKKTCKYQDALFKAPRNPKWIGCCYPSCNLWHHEQCLSLHFKTEQTKENYNLICPKHKEIRTHFKNKIAAFVSDRHALEGETMDVQPLPKRL